MSRQAGSCVFPHFLWLFGFVVFFIEKTHFLASNYWMSFFLRFMFRHSWDMQLHPMCPCDTSTEMPPTCTFPANREPANTRSLCWWLTFNNPWWIYVDEVLEIGNELSWCWDVCPHAGIFLISFYIVGCLYIVYLVNWQLEQWINSPFHQTSEEIWENRDVDVQVLKFLRPSMNLVVDCWRISYSRNPLSKLFMSNMNAQ